MNRRAIDTMVAALRDLDPAPTTVLTEAEHQHADTTFARIIATPDRDARPAESDRPRRRRWRLLVPIGLVGAAGAAVSALLLGGSAFASWTPTPERLTPAETAAAAATCRADLGMPAGEDGTLIAERRGKWTYVLISGLKAEGSCLMRSDRVSADSSGRAVQLGGYTADPGEPPTVARNGLVETGSAATSTDEGWLRKDRWLTSTYGYVGNDVIGVTVHTPLGFDVEASVANGRFAAWWPSAQPSSENLDVMGAWSYTVTLADGSARRPAS